MLQMPTSNPLFPRDPFRRSLGGPLLIALLALAPSARAQSPTGADADTLRVRPGDTLWGIARTHLGNPYRWSDILALNVAVVSDPHWIYPGQRLRLPGELAARPARTPAESTDAPLTDADARPLLAFVDERPIETPAPRPAMPRPAVPPLTEPPPAAVASDTARRSEWYTVPFVDAPGAPRRAGKVVDGVDVGPSDSRTAVRRFQRFDRVVITLPADAAPTPGNTVLLVRRGPDLRGGQVLLPTGMAVVEAESHGLVTARLTRVFDVVQAGQSVIALPDATAPTTAPATAVSTPLESHVVWIAGSAELPTLYGALVLAAGSRDGVREGDRFELVTDARRLSPGTSIPGTRAAIARVVRVTEFGSTALVVSQEQPAVRAGMLVRRLGK
jgi:hypothetical protein